MISRAKRDMIRELVAKATPGPWAVARATVRRPNLGDAHIVYAKLADESEGEGRNFQIVAEWGFAPPGTEEGDDAKFCAMAREAVPELLDEVDRIRAGIRGIAEKIYNGAPDPFQAYYNEGVGQWLRNEVDALLDPPELWGPVTEES